MKTFDTLDAAAQPLLQGQVGVIPTDTVYGVVARAADEIAVTRLYALKERDQKPGTVIAASIDQLVDLGISRRYLTAVEQFWPNAISVIVPIDKGLAYLHAGKYSLAVRIPADEVLQELLETTGPLVTSSANHPGKPTAATVGTAYDYFKENVNFYVDGGDLSDRAPSTILRIVDDAIEVIREGGVHVNERGEIEQ